MTVMMIARANAIDEQVPGFQSPVDPTAIVIVFSNSFLVQCRVLLIIGG